MEPTEDQRRELALRIASRRIQGHATKKAAYTAAGVNSQTWDNAEAGKPLKPHSLRAIVRLLWPETGGDWRLIEPPLQPLSIEDEVRNANLSDKTKAYILSVIGERGPRRPDPEPEAERGAS